MSLGDYPDKIRIEQRVATGKTESGEDSFAWALVGTRSAKYIPLRGRELMAAQQQQAETVASFRLYYTTLVLPQMRVVFRGTFYDIESVIDIGGQREELELMCTTGLTNG